MFFRKCGCLVAHGKYIFRKSFLVWPCVGCKMIFVFILPSNIIFWKTERESVSEIAPARKARERERERGRRESPSPVTHELRLRWQPRDFAPQTQIAVQLRHSTSTSNHTQIAPFDFVGKPRGQDHMPSTSPTSHPSTSPTSHTFDFAEMAQRRYRSHSDRDWEMVGFWWIWLDLCLSIDKWYYIFV